MTWITRVRSWVKAKQLLGGRGFEPTGDGSIVSCNCRGYVMTLRCAGCHHDIDFILWIIVDGNRRPDLLQEIQNGTLHDPTCPRCHHANHMEADLLLLRPDREPVLIFSPAKGNTPDETRKVGRSFLLKLKDQLGAEWKDEWYEGSMGRGMYNVDRSALPSFLRMK